MASAAAPHGRMSFTKWLPQASTSLGCAPVTSCLCSSGYSPADVFPICGCHRDEATRSGRRFCSSKCFSLCLPFESIFLNKELDPEFSQSQCLLVCPGNRIILLRGLPKERSYSSLPWGECGGVFCCVSPGPFCTGRSPGKSITAPEHVTPG